MSDGNELSHDQVLLAFKRIESWLHDRDSKIACPSCDVVGMTVENQSVPPYAEWYALGCSACGLDTMVSRQMGFARWVDPI